VDNLSSIRKAAPINADAPLHDVQAAALESWFVGTWNECGTKPLLDVLEVGTGAGQWASRFDPGITRFTGVYPNEDLVSAARANFSKGCFDLLSADLLFPYEDESFDLVFAVAFMNHFPEPAKRTLLSEMWRVARPSGRLLFLEDFVVRKPQEPASYPISVTTFEDLVLDVTAGQVALEHVESLRYPDENLRRGGLISLRRLGVSRR